MNKSDFKADSEFFEIIDNLINLLVEIGSNTRQDNKFKALELINSTLDYLVTCKQMPCEDVTLLERLNGEMVDLNLKIDKAEKLLESSKHKIPMWEWEMLHSQIICMKDYRYYLDRRIGIIMSKETEVL